MDNFQTMYIENTKNKENKKKEIKKLVNKLTLNNLEALHIRFEIVNILDNIKTEYINNFSYVVKELDKYIKANKELEGNYEKSIDYIDKVLKNM